MLQDRGFLHNKSKNNVLTLVHSIIRNEANQSTINKFVKDHFLEPFAQEYTLFTRIDLVQSLVTLSRLEFNIRWAKLFSFKDHNHEFKLLTWLLYQRSNQFKDSTESVTEKALWNEELLKLKLGKDLEYLSNLESSLVNRGTQRCRLCHVMFSNRDFLGHYQECQQAMKKKIRASEITEAIIHAIKAFEIERKKVRVSLELPMNSYSKRVPKRNVRRNSYSFTDHLDTETLQFTDAFEAFEKYKKAAEALSSISHSFKLYIKELKMDSFRAIHDNLIRQRLQSTLKELPNEQLETVIKKLTTVLTLIEDRLILVSNMVTKEKMIQLERSNSNFSTKEFVLPQESPIKSSLLKRIITRDEDFLELSPALAENSSCFDSNLSSKKDSVKTSSEDSSMSLKAREFPSMKSQCLPKHNPPKISGYHPQSAISVDETTEDTTRNLNPLEMMLGKEIGAEKITSVERTLQQQPKLSQFSRYNSQVEEKRVSTPRSPALDDGYVSPAKIKRIIICDDCERLTESDKGVYFKNDPSLLGMISRVRLSDFYFLRPLGKGAYGEVFLVQSKSRPDDVFALKIICKASNMTSTELKYLLNERNIFEMVEGDFVTKAISTFIHKNLICFLMEYMPGGDLGSLLSKEGGFGEDAVRFYLAEILLGLEDLHKKGVFHRDLKPENVLISKSGHIKLADYGLSQIKQEISQNFTEEDFKNITLESQKTLKSHKEIEQDPTHHKIVPKSDHRNLTRVVGTPDYIAPEILKHRRYSPAADFWALGIIAYELITECPPFNAKTIEEVFSNISKQKISWLPVGRYFLGRRGWYFSRTRFTHQKPTPS